MVVICNHSYVFFNRKYILSVPRMAFLFVSLNFTIGVYKITLVFLTIYIVEIR
jgi:hypothetical protein